MNINIKKKHYDKWERAREAINTFSKLGIRYSMHNLGTQCIIDHNDQIIHYYPTTGRWYIPETKHKATHEERFLGGMLSYMNYDFTEID